MDAVENGVFRGRCVAVFSPVARDHVLVTKSIAITVGTSFVRIARNMLVEVEASDTDLDTLFLSTVEERPLTLVSNVHPCSEPARRVPLSLLKELRGQVPETEQQRQALLSSDFD